MDREELIKQIEELKHGIGMWKVQMNQLTEADYVMGYGFDKKRNQWKIYQNNEKGVRLEYYFDSEEEALLKLYRKLQLQHKILN